MPLILAGLLVTLTIILAFNWRALSEALGFGLSKKRQNKPRRGKKSLVIWLATWGLAIGFLMQRCPGFNCSGSTGSRPPTIVSEIAGSTKFGQFPDLGIVSQVARAFSSDWFYFALLGLIVVGGIILGGGVIIHFNETRRKIEILASIAQEEGAIAVKDAIRILDDTSIADPRERIINCYQRMIKMASDLGAPITRDQTARELESGIRTVLMLTGPGIKELTRLFEEARYSLHSITQNDSKTAHEWLVSIGEELNMKISVPA